METGGIKTTSGVAKIIGTILGIGGSMLMTFYKGSLVHIWPSHIHWRYAEAMTATESTNGASGSRTDMLLGAMLVIASCFAYAVWFIIQICSLDLQEGDTIVMGSDGLFDNVFDQEIISIIYKFEDVNSAAKELASLASGHSNDTNFDSPYSIEARNRGFDVPLWKKILGRKLTGGKPDDITVIVGQRGRWINRRVA